MKRICIAIDIGGTKIRSALIDEAGNMLAANTRATKSGVANPARDDVIAAMNAGIDDLLASVDTSTYQIAGIGISSAGVIDPTQCKVLYAADAIPGWADTAFREIFGSRYGVPIFADNDANCALVGELWRGSYSSDVSAVMLTLGTGLGGAIVNNGALVTGHHSLTGHIGMNLIWDKHQQKMVLVEYLVSGTGLLNIYRQQAGACAAEIANGEQVMKMAANNDPIAEKTIEEWLTQLALQLHNIHWTIDPEIVIIGGGVIHSMDVWWSRLKQKLADYKIDLTISPAKLGNDAGVYGAAKLVWTCLERHAG